MSDKKISNIVSSLLDGMGTISKSETIVGEPQQAGEAMVIPVHRLKVAFGAGTGSAGAHGAKLGGDYTGHGAGGAVEIDPVAAIAVGKDGHAHLLTVEADSGSTWAGLLKDVPDIMGRVAGALGERVTGELKTRGVTAREITDGETEPVAAPDQLEEVAEEK